MNFKHLGQDHESSLLECPFCHEEFWADPIDGDNTALDGPTLIPICPHCGWRKKDGGAA